MTIKYVFQIVNKISRMMIKRNNNALKHVEQSLKIQYHFYIIISMRLMLVNRQNIKQQRKIEKIVILYLILLDKISKCLHTFMDKVINNIFLIL